jgi:predicted ATPase
MATVPDNEAAHDVDDRAQQPFLRRILVQGYKSIAFCDVALQPLTILVGRNAAGKSNFLEALAFLRDLMEMRTTEAVNERRGWRAIHCRTSSSSRIEMRLEATCASFKSYWDADYSFSLELIDQNQVRVHQENLILSEQGRDRRCGYRVADGKLEWVGSENFQDESEWTTDKDIHQLLEGDKLEDPRYFRRPRYDRLALSLIGTQPFVDLAEGLRASSVYNFSPSAIRTHQPIMASPILIRDGRNLARAIEGLREIEPETVQRIRDYLRAIVPAVKDFQIVKYGDSETLRFQLETTAGYPALEFDASNMSDGTLRILAALTAAFQIVLPSGFPGFIGIEEPETALHPAAMRALVDALDEATLRTQILLTTHSADMLDNPTIRPENVRVVEMIDGATVIAPVDAANVDIVRQNLSTLGGLERDNLLEPDLDDLERQRQLAQVRQESPA